jgi:hypothetical protein
MLKAKILVFIWKLYLPEEEVKKRINNHVAREIDYYIKHTSPTGIYITFKEKIKIVTFLIIMVGLSSLYFLMIIFSATHR